MECVQLFETNADDAANANYRYSVQIVTDKLADGFMRWRGQCVPVFMGSSKHIRQ